MKYYNETEKKDADRINQDTIISKIVSRNINSWDEIIEELNSIYNNCPKDYKNMFEEDGKLFYKFWNIEEFKKFIEVTKPNKEVVWLKNTYPKCCYYLAVIHIESKNFEDAFKVLNKGLELEPDNPTLLSELALWFCVVGMDNKDETFLHKSIEYYNKAFNSRVFNTNEQKASALRGIGFVFIELKDYEQAKKFYEKSLEYEDNEIAQNELKFIFEITEKQKIQENKKQLSKEIQNKIPSKYFYIQTKAARLLFEGANKYRIEDYLGYPALEWNENKIMNGAKQIVHLKGLHPNYYINVDCIDDALFLMLTFHFKAIESKDIINSNKEQIKEIKFKHIVDNDEINLFFKINKNNQQ